MDDEQLITTFNEDVRKPVWISARARFHQALREEFDNRGLNYSGLSSTEKGSFNLNHKVKLVGKKIIQNVNNN